MSKCETSNMTWCTQGLKRETPEIEDKNVRIDLEYSRSTLFNSISKRKETHGDRWARGDSEPQPKCQVYGMSTSILT